MRYLIDTQIAVWAKENNPLLTPQGRSLIEDLDNVIFVSQFSLIELAIKLKIGKLPNFVISIENFAESLIEDGFIILPISNQQIFTYQNVPLYSDHRDPFDRSIIATSLANQLTLVSADDQFDRYGSLIDLIKI